mmetsp:Transcript_67376/g.193688  ORF Transcript_67376/g.193688 Transcript_67376/m.193688 type:complete len:315 (+) Transcript_67376:562-1506(+)
MDVRLGGAVLLEIREEGLVLQVRLAGVTELVFHGCDLDARLADPRELRLNGLRKDGGLLLLRSDELVERLDGGLLGSDGILLVLRHLVVDGLEDTRDFAALGCVLVAILGREEGHHLLAVRVHHILAVRQEVAEHGCRAGLQEASGHAPVHGCDGLAERCHVGVGLGHVLVEGALLLRPEGRGIGHGLLGARAVVLVRRDVLLQARFFGAGALDGRTQLGERRLRGLDALGQVATAGLAIALILLEQLLGLLAFLGHLLLQVLEQSDDLADWVHQHLRLRGEGGSRRSRGGEEQELGAELRHGWVSSANTTLGS